MDIRSDLHIGNIKSIQRGTIAVANSSSSGLKTNTASISTVDTTKSVIILLGTYGNFGIVSGGAAGGSVALTNSTTVTASYYSNTSSAETMTIGYQVVEYL